MLAVSARRLVARARPPLGTRWASSAAAASASSASSTKPGMRPSPEELAEKNARVMPFFQAPATPGGKGVIGGGDPLGIIQWAAAEFDGRVAMSTSMGLQAAVLLHMATRVLPNIPVVWVDTGYLPKETYLYAEELKQTLGLNLIVQGNSEWSAARMEAVHGKLWEKDDVDSHTLYGKMRKVDPLVAGLNLIQPSPLALLSGLRAGQTKARANMDPVGFSQGRYKILPMLKMSDDDIANYMDKHDLPKHPLQAQGYVTVGDWHSSRPVQPGEDPRATRFGGKFEECGLHVETHEATTTTPSTSSSQPAAPAAAAPTAEVLPPPTTPPGGEHLQLPAGLEALAYTLPNENTGIAVIMVKKRNEDGTWCRKCNDVMGKMEADNVLGWIGHTAVADVTNAKSEGVLLSQRFQVATAPFFLIRTKEETQQGANWRPIRSYLQLKKILQDAATAIEERRQGMPAEEKEAPQLAEYRRHAEEIRAQIALLDARLKETESLLMASEARREGSAATVAAVSAE